MMGTDSTLTACLGIQLKTELELAWQCMSVILPFMKLNQEGYHEFKAHLS